MIRPEDVLRQGEQAFAEKDFHKAERLFLQAADQGYAPACDRLGDLYFDCIGVMRDYEKAASRYAKTLDFSIDPTSPRDRFKAGLCYETGVGVGKDEKRAFSLYERAKDDVRGAYRLALCFLNGIGTEKDEEQAVFLLIPLAENGYANAQNTLGFCYYQGQGVEQSYEQAVYWYKKAAEQGHALAQNTLGFCYEKGQGVEQSYEQAVVWFVKAAEQGSAVAQNNLGICYENGRGVEQSYEKAVEWYQKAAEQGNAGAQFNLGVCYYQGQGVEQSYEKAVEWYKKAAEQGHIVAQSNLGICYANGWGVEQSYEQAVVWYQKAAERGQAAAQYNLGICYYNGQGVEQSHEKAVYWWTKAAEQGDANAQNNLSICYANGRGVEQSYEQAVVWYQKAAEQGHASAQYNLGICYDNGRGVEQSYEKAVEWHKKAAEQGYADAQRRVGHIYWFGQGVEQSNVKAIEWWTKAAKNGDAGAQVCLGAIYSSDNEFESVKQSYKKAAFWLKKAAKQGNSDAQSRLGSCYFFGNGISQSYKKALELWKKSAEQGYAGAQYNLGVCYYNGHGVEQSHEKAVYWWRKAAEQGYEDAQNALSNCYRNGQGVEQSYAQAVKWSMKAAEQGHIVAQYDLGVCYYNGQGVEQSYEQAVKWYTKAAEQGNAGAQNNLGLCYYNGQGVEQSYEKALFWCRKAAEQGNAVAQSNIGECYEKGEGVERDVKQALYWYRKAVENGFEKAQEAIDRLEKERNKLILAEKKDVFLSWNNKDEAFMQAVKNLLEGRGYSVWDSDAACVGEIDEACLNAIKNSQTWIVLVSENSLQSAWVKKEIECIEEQIGNSPELKTCLIPFYFDENARLMTEEIRKRDEKDAFARLMELGGVYGLEEQGKRIVDLVKTSLSGRKMIEYRQKAQDVSALFNAFIASRLEMSDESAEVGLKCKMDVDYIPRTVKIKSGETLDEAAFVGRVENAKATLLYAQGGAGKSLYLQSLLHSYFSADRYIFTTTAKALAEYLENDRGKDALVRFFVQDVNETVGYGREVDPASFYGLFKLLHNKIIFVIDALDELGGDETLRQRICDATVKAPIATESNVHFLFTSRRSTDGAFLGVDESYELVKFSREDGYAVAKRVFDRFAQKYKGRGGAVGIDGREEKVTLSDRTLYVELDKLRDEIAANPLLVTNFVILFVDHLTSGAALPINDYEIAEKSVAFLLKDVERDRLSVNREVDKKALDMLDGILCDLAYRRALGDTRKTTEIFADYLTSRSYEGNAEAEAERLLRYLRSRAIVMGDERHGNVYHAIFQAYLAARAIYNDCYAVKRGKLGANVVFGTVCEDDVEYSGSAVLAYNADTYFRKDVAPWTDVEPFLVADLDKNIFDLPGVDENNPLRSSSQSYETLEETLSCLYGTEKDKARHAYETLCRMIDAHSVYNIDAIRAILGI